MSSGLVAKVVLIMLRTMIREEKEKSAPVSGPFLSSLDGS